MSNVFKGFSSIVREALAAENLPVDAAFTVEPPRDAAHGDWTTNVAMVLAKPMGKPPRAIAEMLLPHISKAADIEKVDIAGAGFINVTMKASFWQNQMAQILSQGTSFGASDLGQGVSTNIEYVSANPTGPMHIGHLRNACFGDALANLMVKAGYNLTREFYVNDAGNQMDILARSVYLRYREALGETVTMPEGMYPADYVKDCAAALLARDGKIWFDKPESDWLDPIKLFAGEFFLNEIKSDLQQIAVTMDVYTSERALRASGAVGQCIDFLRERGLVYQGVLEPPKGKVLDDWEPKEQTLFRSTQFGDDVDRPLIKANGDYTYFAPDIAYHFDKFKRSGQVMVTVVGDGHAGWVSRIKAAVAAVSEGKAKFSVKMYALVKILENGQPVRMSKRAGNFITLRDAVDKVGKDVLRFVMLTRAPEQILEFDFAKVIEHSKDNPVFYVQYAYARCQSVLRQAAAQGLKADAAMAMHLNDNDELALIKKMLSWPRLVEQAAVAQEPHRVAYYLQELAAAFHGLWNKGADDATLRFIRSEAPEQTAARLALVTAAATVVASGLEILGVQPIEEMR